MSTPARRISHGKNVRQETNRGTAAHCREIPTVSGIPLDATPACGAGHGTESVPVVGNDSGGRLREKRHPTGPVCVLLRLFWSETLAASVQLVQEVFTGPTFASRTRGWSPPTYEGRLRITCCPHPGPPPARTPGVGGGGARL